MAAARNPLCALGMRRARKFWPWLEKVRIYQVSGRNARSLLAHPRRADNAFGASLGVAKGMRPAAQAGEYPPIGRLEADGWLIV